MHFLPSAEVFSVFPIVTPIGRAPNKKAIKATKISCLPLRPKDFLIFCFVLYYIYHIIGLCQTIFYYNNLKELGPTQTATGIFIDYGLLMIDYWVVGSENDEAGGQNFRF
jgi:hypothetical protein